MAAARQLAEDSSDLEKSLRAASEKWIAGITALLGLFGLATLITGKDTLTSLPLPYRAIAAGLAGLSILLAALAILKIYRAAYGWPTVVDVSNDANLLEWFGKRSQRLATAASDFRTGVVASIVSLLALVLAVGIFLFAPQELSKPTVRLTLAGGDIVCGELLSSAGSSTNIIRLRSSSSGKVEQPPVGSVTRVDIVAECTTS